MTLHNDPVATRANPAFAAFWNQGAWLARCQASLWARDPLLAAEDIHDLAITLWRRPSCQKVPPEMAVDLLFADQLARLT